MDEIQAYFYAAADDQPIATLSKATLIWSILRNIEEFEEESFYENGAAIETDWALAPYEFKTLSFKYNGYWHIVFENHPKLEERIVLIASKSIPLLIQFLHDSEFSDDVSMIDRLRDENDHTN